LIILILIPIIILAFLKNKGFLPEDAFNALMLVVSISYWWYSFFQEI